MKSLVDAQEGEADIREQQQLSPSTFRFAVRKLLLESERRRRSEKRCEDPNGETDDIAFCPGERRCRKFFISPQAACQGCEEREYKVFTLHSGAGFQKMLEHCLWIDAKFQAGWRPAELNALSPLEWEMREILCEERNWLEKEVMRHLEQEQRTETGPSFGQ